MLLNHPSGFPSPCRHCTPFIHRAGNVFAWQSIRHILFWVPFHLGTRASLQHPLRSTASVPSSDRNRASLHRTTGESAILARYFGHYLAPVKGPVRVTCTRGSASRVRSSSVTQKQRNVVYRWRIHFFIHLTVLGTVCLPWLGYAEPPYWGRISSLTILRRQAGGIMRHASTIHYIHRLYKTARQIDTPKNSARNNLSAPVMNHVAHVSASCPVPVTPGGIRIQPSQGKFHWHQFPQRWSQRLSRAIGGY